MFRVGLKIRVGRPTGTTHTFHLGLNKNFQRKIVIFLPIILAYVLGAQKNRLVETVLLSTHNVCFD